jgi:glycosyltransferase involved in cell wall biosynthesis
MRLIIPIEFYRHGGVERVIISLIRELSTKIDKIIIVLSPNNITYFQSLLPESEVIVYETFSLGNSIESKFLGFYNKLLSLSYKLKLTKIRDNLTKFTNQYHLESRLNQLIQKYQATHCLYVLTNNLIPPRLYIPLAMISHDVFWHFSPLNYGENYIKKYDANLLTWLKTVNGVFTVSEKTRQDILTIFPQFEGKIKTIPNASNIPYFPSPLDLPLEKGVKNNQFIFYFPSSFGIYKDQLTLLKAGIQLVKKGLNFKVVLTGKETDSFIQGKLTLSQQNQTQEYQQYLTECQQVYQENKEIIERYFLGLGYGSEEDVENWYNQADCVVVPSQYEGFGLALSEAIVRGIPVICSDLEVFKEQVNLYQCPDRVTFFNTGNVDSLANSMEDFIHNPKPKLSPSEIEQRFSHWTWKQVAEIYLTLLNKL